MLLLSCYLCFNILTILGQCNIKQERSLNCQIIYKVSGKCFFASSAISKCKFKANLSAYRNGVTEASVVIADKVHILKEGQSLRTCAQFEMKNDVLTIVEDICKQSCLPAIAPAKWTQNWQNVCILCTPVRIILK